MKKILIYRENDYTSNVQPISIFLNNDKYIINSNSSLTINTDEKSIKVYAKLLWMKTKVIELNEEEVEFKIRIKPFIENFHLKIAFVLFFISVIFMCTEYDLLDLIARIMLITMMAIFVYSFTIGYQSYLKLEINKVK